MLFFLCHMHRKTVCSQVQPVLPPDLKAKRSVILWRCDNQILNKKEDIRTEIEKQNVCVKVQDIFKYDCSKNIKVTFENQHLPLLLQEQIGQTLDRKCPS